MVVHAVQDDVAALLGGKVQQIMHPGGSPEMVGRGQCVLAPMLRSTLPQILIELDQFPRAVAQDLRP